MTDDDLVKRLKHAIATAQNDDYTKPSTTERERHTARVMAMYDAIDRLTALEEENARLRKALDKALVAMRIASALPGVSDEYDFSEAIAAVIEARTLSSMEGKDG